MDDQKEYEEYLAYLKHTGKKAPALDPEPTTMDYVKTGLGYAVKPLDYLGGLVRTGVAGTAQLGANAAGKAKELVTGEADNTPQIVTGDDALAALKGSAPSTKEYLERGGVTDLGKLSDVAPVLFSKDPNSWRPTPGGNFDPSVRGTIGMAADMALDPLTYVGAGPLKALLGKAGKAGVVAEHVLNPAENALKAGGKSIYKSAPIMQAADAINDRFGKQAASDILFDQGVRGTGRGVATQAEKLAEATGLKRDALLATADKAGAVLDMKKAMTPADEFIAKVRASRDPQLQGVADALEERVKSYKKLTPKPASKPMADIIGPSGEPILNKAGSRAPVTASQGSGFKSSLYNDTGNAVWDSLRRTPQGKLGNRALARGLDAEVSAAAERALPGVGTQIDTLNDTWGKLLTPKKVLEQEALKGEKKNLITSVDGIVAGLSHGSPAVMAAKKGTDLLKTNWLKTNVGRGAYKLGDTPLLDEVLRRELINRSNQSDWEKLRK